MTDKIVDASRVIQYRYYIPEYLGFKDSDLPTIEEVLEAGKEDIKRGRSNADNLYLTDADLHELVGSCLDEIKQIEHAATSPDRWNVPFDEAKKTRLVIDFSAPGTYFLPFKNDRYQAKPWAALMDRKRADTAAILGIHLAGIAMGKDFSSFTKARLLDGLNPEFESNREEVHQSIRDANIHFLYLGTPQEASGIRKVINSPSSFVPRDMVDVVDSVEGRPIDNTLDQVDALKHYFQSRQNIFQDGDKADFVLGPQAVRVFRICRQMDAIPHMIVPQVFPESTPQIGIKEYPTNEIRGTMYYVLTRKAHILPADFKIIGSNINS